MSTSTASDTESLRIGVVVVRCQTGDDRAFTDLYDMFADRTMRYLTTIVGPQSAEDVHQDVWLTVYREIAGLANPFGFRTWLYRITRNRAIDALRRVKRHQELLGTPIDKSEAQTQSNQDHADISFETTDGIVSAIAQLSPAHRDVLILAFWEEMPYSEIALVVGCPIGTVRSRIHNAKKQLRRVLADV